MFYLLLSVVLVGYGASSLFMYSDVGGIAIKSGRIIYGYPALFVALFFIFIGLLSILNYLKQRNKKCEQTYKPGEFVAIVNKKNMSFGLVKSLELVLNDKQSFTFYCTTDKVAAMLLNDFVVGQEATLKINTEDGKDCDLVGINAYAHGILIGQ